MGEWTARPCRMCQETAAFPLPSCGPRWTEKGKTGSQERNTTSLPQVINVKLIMPGDTSRTKTWILKGVESLWMSGHKRLRRKVAISQPWPTGEWHFSMTRRWVQRGPAGKTGLGDRELRIPRPSVISTKAERLGAGENQRKEEIKGSLGINLMGFYFCFS